MTHNHKITLCALLSTSVAAQYASAQKSSEASSSRPNVVFIVTDQQSYNMMSCTGNKWLKTPNMDRIANTGYRFDRAYCANPLSMPSRFTLLTGYQASAIGIKTNSIFYDKEKVKQICETNALGNILTRSGYKALYSGKTHLPGNESLYGFQIEGLDPYDGPAIYAEKTMPKLAQEPRQPFFMFLSFLNPHDICYGAGIDDRYPDRLDEENVRETRKLLAYRNTLSEKEYEGQLPPFPANFAPINDEPKDMGTLNARENWDKKQWRLYNWMYCRLCESVDAQIGRVLDALQASGLADNTIIILTSDHGEMNGSHGLTTKNFLFEECQRVPFIFAGKGIKSGVVDKKSLVCNGLDLIPTICELTQMATPNGITGISLAPLMTGKGKLTPRDYIITEDCNGFQINNGEWKYSIFELPNHPEILTNIKNDPGETKNLASDKSCTKIKSNLKELLMADLSKRGLLPLSEQRTHKNIRLLEKGTNVFNK